MPATTSESHRLLTAQETAQRLGVRVHRAYELIREGTLPGVVRIGRQIRVDPGQLESFIENGGTADS